MRVLKASAGSGKTYNLAGTYIDLLLSSDDRYAYRHILAVTFTNKATAEMKSRILRDLGRLAADNPKARSILMDILHDYSAFAVSTIDRFFQQALKAFSREIGQFSSYQIELDRNSLIMEAMDRMLDGLTRDKKDLVEWLKASVMDKVEQGQKFSMDQSLYEIGSRLKSDEHREIRERFGISEDAEFTKDRLSEVRKSCRKVIADFHERVKAAAQNLLPVLPDKAVRYLNPYLKGFKAWEDVTEPNKTLSKAGDGSDFMELFGEPFRIYRTARQIDRLLFSLGIASEFQNEFKSLLKEKNVMPLDESNTILKDIIDGSDAPFVYEKLGVRYEHFLLDEFQDTSSIQWDNFLPLLRESESGGGRNLIVGDIKQSIYRWRNSDWRLLGEEVPRQFPDADIKALDSNWRSTRMVVEFNNSFFTHAAGVIGASDIYSDAVQKVQSKDPQEGFVHVSFVEDQEEAVLQSIADARDHGARWNDIALLVRNRKEGARIASLLIDHQMPVISDDSLALKSSVVVRRLVSLLSFMDNPGNSVGSYLAQSMNIEYPSTYHSLVDLCECLLRSLREYDPASMEGETLFIQAFMDDLQSWVDINGNNLMHYLAHWAESDPVIGSPENSESIRVLTVHKSKGLEFPYVIFPYAENVGMFKEGVHWCHLDAGSSPLGSAASGIYPVSLGKGAASTMFSEAYDAERRMQAIDNINVFYVALTRAGKAMHIISKIPSKTFREALEKGREQYGNFAELLFAFCGRSYDCMWGTPYDFNAMEREDTESGEQDFPAGYPSIPLADRLSASDDAFDFFGEDGSTGVAASARIRGIALHNILSQTDSPDDLRTAVDSAVMDGILDRSQGDTAFRLLSERIEAHREWFNARAGVRFRNEETILDTDGSEHRPDRVIIDGSHVTVIDYKFGEEKESYLWQVRRYCKLYRRMGFSDVEGYLWYVAEDRLVKV